MTRMNDLPMAQRKLRLEIQQSQEEGGCGGPRIPRWYGQHAITTNDITGSVTKILITDSKGKQISITIDNNGSIREIDGNRKVEDHGMWIDQSNSQNKLQINLENNQPDVVTRSENAVKKELEEPGEPGTESSLSFKEVIEVISEGYDNLESLDGPEVEEEFHAEMEEIKSEEISLVGKFETVYINSGILPENYELPRPEQSSESSSVMFESINDTIMPLMCRLCATRSKDMVDIFGNNEASKSITEKIEDCLRIVVRKTDALPKEVCRLCLEKLEMCYKFHKIVSEAEKQFIMPREKQFDESRNTEECCNNFPVLHNGQLDPEKPSKDLVLEPCALSLTRSPESENSLRKIIIEEDNANEDVVFIGKAAKADTVTDQFEDYDIIKCRICGKYFGTAKSCYKHSDIHHSENHYPCSMCDEIFTTKKDSYYHSQEHMLPNPYQRRKTINRISGYNLRSNSITKSNTSSNGNEKIAEKDNADDNILRDKEAGDNQTSAAQNNDHDMVKCRICGLYFGTAKSCYTHSSVHVSENHHPCSMCNESFTNEKDSLKHSQEHIVYKTHQRRAAMYRNELLQSSSVTSNNKLSNSTEKISEKDTAGGNIPCDEITNENQTFINRSNGNGMINCRICRVGLRNAKGCYQHSIVHIKKNHYPCCICHKNFTSERHAYKHNQEHVLGKWNKNRPVIHVCNICGKRFGTEDRLKFHKIYHDPKMKPCYCEKCDKVMSSETSLYHHIPYMHNGRKKYNCNMCKKQFRSKLQLTNHQLQHKNRSFECSLCNRKFFSKDKLNFHSLHNCRSLLNIENYSCFYCNKTFVRKCCLINHIRKHTEGRPYRCEFCLKTYLNNRSRVKHQKTHTDGELLKCSGCEKRFFDSAQLKKHEKIHLENRLHKCSICNKSFKSEKTRKQHIRFVHTSDKPYKCETCGQKFVRPSSLRLHKRIRHGTE